MSNTDIRVANVTTVMFSRQPIRDSSQYDPFDVLRLRIGSTNGEETGLDMYVDPKSFPAFEHTDELLSVLRALMAEIYSDPSEPVAPSLATGAAARALLAKVDA